MSTSIIANVSTVEPYINVTKAPKKEKNYSVFLLAEDVDLTIYLNKKQLKELKEKIEEVLKNETNI